MVFGNDDREYARPVALPDWLKEFADKELKKGSPFEDIKNIFNRNDPMAVEAKVQELQKMVGLDLISKEATIRHVERAKERGEGTTMKWCVYPKSGGKALGCHDTKEGAEKQLQAIEINKSDDFYIQEVKESIHGGFGDNQPDDRYDKEQLEKGIKVELEHTSDPEKAKEIAKDHLEESKDFKGENGGKYYDKLEEMEEEFEEDLVSKKSRLDNLILIANKLDQEGNFQAASFIDKQIQKLAKEIVEKNVFEKYPGIQKHIDNVCQSRQGHIDVPALLDIIRSRPEKITDSEFGEIKEYVKNKIKEERKDLNLDKDDDIIGLSETTFVVNEEDDGNNEVFSKPSKV